MANHEKNHTRFRAFKEAGKALAEEVGDTLDEGRLTRSEVAGAATVGALVVLGPPTLEGSRVYHPFSTDPASAQEPAPPAEGSALAEKVAIFNQQAATLPQIPLEEHRQASSLSTKGVSRVKAKFVNGRTITINAKANLDNTYIINAPPGPDKGAKRIGWRALSVGYRIRGRGSRSFNDFTPTLVPLIVPAASTEQRVDKTHLKTEGVISTGNIKAKLVAPRYKRRLCMPGSSLMPVVLIGYESRKPSESGMVFANERPISGRVIKCPVLKKRRPSKLG